MAALDIFDAPDETVRDEFTNPILELFCRLKTRHPGCRRTVFLVAPAIGGWYYKLLAKA